MCLSHRHTFGVSFLSGSVHSTFYCFKIAAVFIQWWERMVPWNGRVKQEFYTQIDVVCLMASSE